MFSYLSARNVYIFTLFLVKMVLPDRSKSERLLISVESHLYFRDAVMAFKCMTGVSPEYLSNKFIPRGSISGRVTRNSQKFKIKHPTVKISNRPEVFFDIVLKVFGTLLALY